MKSNLDEALGAAPELATLYALARRRRSARDRAQEEFAEGTHVDSEEEAPTEPMRLAAADLVAARFVGAGIELDWEGNSVCLRAGPAGLALRDGSALVPLVVGARVMVSSVMPGDEIVLVDRRGRTSRLRRV